MNNEQPNPPFFQGAIAGLNEFIEQAASLCKTEAETEFFSKLLEMVVAHVFSIYPDDFDSDFNDETGEMEYNPASEWNFAGCRLLHKVVPPEGEFTFYAHKRIGFELLQLHHYTPTKVTYKFYPHTSIKAGESACPVDFVLVVSHFSGNKILSRNRIIIDLSSSSQNSIDTLYKEELAFLKYKGWKRYQVQRQNGKYRAIECIGDIRKICDIPL